MNKIFRVTAVAAVYIGTVIGAGFASGREIWQFFSQYNAGGTWGLLCSTIFLSVLGPKAMAWGKRIRASSYHDFLHSLAGKWVGRAGDLIITIFLLVLLGIMLAGSGAIAVQLGGEWEWGCWGTAILAVIILSRRLEGIKGVNLIIIPLLFATGIVLNLNGPSFSPAQSTPVAPVEGDWLLAAFQYSAYNLILALPVLVTLYRLDDDAAVLRWGGVLGGITLGVLAFLFHRVMAATNGGTGDLPLFFLTEGWGKWWRYGYAVVLWGELFSTLIAHGYGLATRLGPAESRKFTLRVTGLLALAGLIGKIGFSRLIMNLYPLFGLVSFFLLLPLFLRPLPASRKAGRKPVACSRREGRSRVRGYPL